MKICFVGKYPPIQGGVSTANYWLAYGLAELGHEVYVVTNAGEVEADYRIRLSEDDLAWYEPEFGPSGRSVRVFQPERLDAGRMAHIPLANPFVSKLASVATQVVRKFDCDLIFAFYYEPYGVAGYLASLWTKRPLVLRHAGSDLDRLMRTPSLATTYQEILKAADAVVTRVRLLPRFLGMGVPLEKIYSDASFGHPKAVFNPQAEPLDINLQLAATRSGSSAPVNESPFDPGKPTIGIYGKVGLYKGSYDLVATLGNLAAEGLDFNFLAMTQGREFKRFLRELENHGLMERTWLLPFHPHWKVPGFIRSCTAVCFLERDFPINIHGPMIPREVLSCGGCLVLSGEIARKQAFSKELVDGRNILLVDDPKDHKALAEKLRLVIQDPARAREIGKEGHALSAHFPTFASYVRHYEDLFRRCSGEESEAKSLWETLRDAAPARREPAAVMLDHLMPWLRTILHEDFAPLKERFLESLNGSAGQNPVRSALAFCGFIAESPEVRRLEADIPCFPDLLRYQTARLANEFENGEFYVSRGHSGLFTERTDTEAGGLEGLRPFRVKGISIESYRHDVTPLFSGTLLKRNPDRSQLVKAVREMAAKPIFVIFHKTPNLKRNEIKVSPATKSLLDLCDGTRTAADIVEAMRPGWNGNRETLQSEVLATLRYLKEKRIISFSPR